MRKSLRDEVQVIAETFVRGVFEAIMAAPVDELGDVRFDARAAAVRSGGSRQAPTRAAEARPGRRPRALDSAALDRVLSTLRAHPGGMRSEHLRTVTGIPKPELVRVLKHALAARKIAKRGEKRTTTYFFRG